MPKVCELPQQFQVRPAGVVAVNFSLDLDALRILHQEAPSPKTRGRFLSRLLYEFAARQEERARLRQQQDPIGSDTDGD